jgi:uncharacterized protein (TIGR02569 family)
VSGLCGSEPQSPRGPLLAAFGLTGEPVALEGGRGLAFRVGSVVLKRAGDPIEDEWRAALYERIVPDGFRVPRPMRSVDDRVVVDGWVAFEWLSGEHSLERWDDVLAVCDRFHAALKSEPRPALLDSADDPWTTAQRAVWGLTSLEAYLGLKHVARLVEALRPVDAPEQLVHSDVTANVLFDPGLSPAVIDLSPWWAPVEYARAIVVGDALLWYGADASLAPRVDPQFFLRAVLFRKIVDRLFRPDEPERPDETDLYLPVVELALELAG